MPALIEIAGPASVFSWKSIKLVIFFKYMKLVEKVSEECLTLGQCVKLDGVLKPGFVILSERAALRSLFSRNEFGMTESLWSNRHAELVSA